MKSSFLPHLAAIASMAFLTSASHAAVIFTDDFTAAGTGAWYNGTSTGAALANVTNQLQFGPLGALSDKNEIFGRSFTEQTLTVGQTIRLTFDFTQTATAGILRAGFADRSLGAITASNWASATVGGTYGGYYSFVRDNSALGNSAREDTAGTAFTNLGTSGAPTFGGSGISFPALDNTQFDIVDATTYQGMFEVTRTSLTQVDTLFTLMSGVTTHFSIAGRDTATTMNVFDTVVLRIDTGTASFDNIQVSVIPEPSAALLGGLGLLVLLRRRR